MLDRCRGEFKNECQILNALWSVDKRSLNGAVPQSMSSGDSNNILSTSWVSVTEEALGDDATRLSPVIEQCPVLVNQTTRAHSWPH
jgi:hypothetical protein